MSNVTGEFGVALTESQTTCTVGNLSRGSRETPVTSLASMAGDRSAKAEAMMPTCTSPGSQTDS